MLVWIQTIELPNGATLDGTVSDDGNPTPPGIVTTAWSKVSGPGTVTFADASAVDTTADFSVAGVYVLRLTADDSALSSSDDVTITVNQPNQAPSVNAGSDQAITLPASATLSGTATDDGLPNPPGAIVTTWSMISGSGTATFVDVNDVNTAVSFSTDGVYVLRLTADDSELTAADDVTITVNPPPNQAPNVDAGSNQTVSLANSASLDGTVTDDGLPDPPATVTTLWDTVSGPGTVTFTDDSMVDTLATFSATGVYVLRLTADDSDLTANDTVTVTVIPNNQPPTVDAGIDQIISLPDDAMLDGTVTDDGLPTGTVVTTWSLFSGPTAVTFADASAVDTTVSFSQPGTYVLRLTADDGEYSVNDDVTITVNPPPNQAPTVDAGLDETIALPSNAKLKGSASDDGLPNPPGSIVTTWSTFSGPGTVTFSNANALNSNATFSVAGVYVLQLMADDTELTATDFVTFTVLPPNQAPIVDAGLESDGGSDGYGLSRWYSQRRWFTQPTCHSECHLESIQWPRHDHLC